MGRLSQSVGVATWWRYDSCWCVCILYVITAILYSIHRSTVNQCNAFRSCYDGLWYEVLHTIRESKFWTCCKWLLFLLVVTIQYCIIIVESGRDDWACQCCGSAHVNLPTNVSQTANMIVTLLHRIRYVIVKRQMLIDLMVTTRMQTWYSGFSKLYLPKFWWCTVKHFDLLLCASDQWLSIRWIQKQVINDEKTKVMASGGTACSINILGVHLEKFDIIAYLGSLLRRPIVIRLPETSGS